MAAVPLRCDDVEGTLQLGRRLARPFAPSEVLLLQLLSERLAALFAAGASAVLLDQAEEAVEE
jgi:GAF domain-containing protein